MSSLNAKWKICTNQDANGLTSKFCGQSSNIAKCLFEERGIYLLPLTLELFFATIVIWFNVWLYVFTHVCSCTTVQNLRRFRVEMWWALTIIRIDPPHSKVSKKITRWQSVSGDPGSSERFQRDQLWRRRVLEIWRIHSNPWTVILSPIDRSQFVALSKIMNLQHIENWPLNTYSKQTNSLTDTWQG